MSLLQSWSRARCLTEPPGSARGGPAGTWDGPCLTLGDARTLLELPVILGRRGRPQDICAALTRTAALLRADGAVLCRVSLGQPLARWASGLDRPRLAEDASPADVVQEKLASQVADGPAGNRSLQVLAVKTWTCLYSAHSSHVQGSGEFLAVYRSRASGSFGTREVGLMQLLHNQPVWPADEGDPASRDVVPLRQRQVLELLCEGFSEKEVAQTLGISVHTVHVYVKALHKRYGVNSRGELLRAARQRG